MALLLAFDTAAAQCAAALLKDGRVLASREEAMVAGQAERLLPMLEEMLADAGAAWRDLDALGAGTGPGNFTGVRVAVALARGLALGLGRPALGVTRFEALAWGREDVLVALDARGGLLHLQAFGAAAWGPLTAGPGDPLPALPPGLPVVGDAAEAAAARAGGVAAEPVVPIAEGIARTALPRLGRDGSHPAPLYLRPPDAAPPRDPPPPVIP